MIERWVAHDAAQEAQITDGTRISEFVDRAWQAATTGYPGPVHLSLPVDIMFSSYAEDAGRDERPFDRSDKPPPRAWPDPQQLDRILGLVRSAERPVIIAGDEIVTMNGQPLLSMALTGG